MPSRAELRDRRSRLARTWESLLAGGRPVEGDEPEGLDPGVLDSWRRSSEWVSPDLVAAPVDDPDDAIAHWRRGPVAHGLAFVEEDVRRVADDADLIAAVTDGRTYESDGMVDGVVRELRGGKPFRHLRSVV